MKLENGFDVAAPVADVWPLLNDLEVVATCMPGAQLDSVEGDAFTGTMTMKLGALSLRFRGQGMVVERDEANRRMVMNARGKDAKGTGTANADVSLSIAESPDRGTTVSVQTDLNVSGRLAQLGNSAMRDVSDRLAQQFATALEQRVADSAASTSSADVPAPASRGEVPAHGAPPLDLVDVMGETPKRIVIAAVSLLVGLLAGRFLGRNQRDRQVRE
jgi:carbon monoxide dehydrogenase subunit G